MQDADLRSRLNIQVLIQDSDSDSRFRFKIQIQIIYSDIRFKIEIQGSYSDPCHFGSNVVSLRDFKTELLDPILGRKSINVFPHFLNSLEFEHFAGGPKFWLKVKFCAESFKSHYSFLEFIGI